MPPKSEQIPEAWRQNIEKGTEEPGEHFERKAKVLRQNLIRELEKEYEEDQEISDEDWQEIYASLPDRFVELFQIDSATDLDQFVRFGETGLLHTQQFLLEFDVPETFDSLDDVEAFSNNLAYLECELYLLGEEENGHFNREKANSHAGRFLKRLVVAQTKLTAFQETIDLNDEQIKRVRYARSVAQLTISRSSKKCINFMS